MPRSAPTARSCGIGELGAVFSRGGEIMKTNIPTFVLAASILAATGSHAGTLFKDNFDKDADGQFPSNWQLVYDGDGSQNQVVNSTHHVSKPNALNLVGSQCWSANAYHPVTLNGRHITLKGDVSIINYDTGGCTVNVAAVALTDPSLGEWGTYYTGVDFENDGIIHAISGSSNPALLGYATDKWYKIVVEVNLDRETSDIYINGKQVGRNMPFTTSGMPTGVELYAGHSATPPSAWFDNVVVETTSVLDH
jgi:hypothetical protein